jgi:hypothetical protein
MRSTHDSQGKHAVTHYRVLGRFSTLTSLEVTLGPKNQIRVHLSKWYLLWVSGPQQHAQPLDRLGLHLFSQFATRRAARLLHSTGPPPDTALHSKSSSGGCVRAVRKPTQSAFCEGSG